MGLWIDEMIGDHVTMMMVMTAMMHYHDNVKIILDEETREKEP